MDLANKLICLFIYLGLTVLMSFIQLGVYVLTITVLFSHHENQLAWLTILMWFVGYAWSQLSARILTQLMPKQEAK